MYDPGAAGGSIRQVDREEARRYIKATIMQFRMSTIRKWHFGTNWTTYYEHASFAPSDLARRVWEEDQSRRGALRDRSPTGRGRGSSPCRAEKRYPSRPSYTWTNRRSTTPPKSAFPPTPRSPTPPPNRTTTPPARPFFDGPSMETESDASSAPRFGAAASSSRQCGGPRPSDTDDGTVPSSTVSHTTMARPTTAFSYDCRSGREQP